MSDLIRTVRSSWLPMPTQSSDDVRPSGTANAYQLAQMAIEASERLHQRQIDRMIRAGRQPQPQANNYSRLPLESNLSQSVYVLNMPRVR